MRKDAETVDIVAKAISNAMERGFPEFTRQKWEDLTPLAREAMRERARAAITAIQAIESYDRAFA